MSKKPLHELPEDVKALLEKSYSLAVQNIDYFESEGGSLSCHVLYEAALAGINKKYGGLR